MSVDTKIIEAIEKAVAQHRQPSSLATKIVAWLEALSAGNEDLNDKQSADRRLELLYDATPAETEEGKLF
ncbi:MAG: CxC ATPase DNA modification system associated small protein [Caldilineaceae bacterium]